MRSQIPAVSRVPDRWDEIRTSGFCTYDKQGRPISTRQWTEYFADYEGYRQIGDTYIGPWRISTVWMGNDMSFWGKTPIIFETMVFGEPFHLDGHRYATEMEAGAGHAEFVDRVAQYWWLTLGGRA